MGAVQIAATALACLNEAGAKKIVATCAHCFNTLANEYGQVGGHYEVVKVSGTRTWPLR